MAAPVHIKHGSREVNSMQFDGFIFFFNISFMTRHSAWSKKSFFSMLFFLQDKILLFSIINDPIGISLI